MRGREIPANTRLAISRELLAECAWEYGEHDLAERVSGLSDDDLDQVQRLALWHRTNDPEPEGEPKLTNARIEARAVIEFFEGRTRDTKRARRRTRPREEGYLGAATGTT
jgi:hypothetical protein